MQTKLRTAMLLFVASLLWACPASAATQKTARPHAVHKAKPGYFGVASWYGQQHQGRKMANGKRFDRRKLTAASWYFPLGTVVRVMNLENGKSVVVTITDRGPNLRLHRTIDLSEAAARKLGYVGQGLTKVLVSPMMNLETTSTLLNARLMEPTRPATGGGSGFSEAAK